MRPANHVGKLALPMPSVVTDGVLESKVGGRYRLIQSIGSGGEGSSFRAVDEVTGRVCALKLFRAPAVDVVARVRTEFQRLIGADHPNVVRALDVGRDHDRLYLVTEFVTGKSIASIAAIDDVAHRRVLFLRAAREVADALGYLHAQGVVHGDVSPENIRLAEDGRAILIDLAAATKSTGGASGTLGFAAPEALIGRITPAADLFGLGATLFLAWTGVGPFGTGTDAVIRMLSGPAPVVSAVRPGLSQGWDDLLSGLLRREPEQRCSSARTVLRELGRLDPRGEPMEPALLPPHPAGDPMAGIFVGRSVERALLKREFERLGEGISSRAVIALVGVEGSGRRALMDVALRDLAITQLDEPTARIEGPADQIRQPSSPVEDSASLVPLSVFRGTLATLADWLRVTADNEAKTTENDPGRAQQRLFARLAAELDARAARAPLVVALGADAQGREFAAFVAGAQASGRWLVLVASREPLLRVASLNVILSPLSSADVQQLVARAAGETVPGAAVDRLATAAAGHPATITILARQLVAAIRRGDGDRFEPAPDLALEQLLGRSFAMLDTGARRLVARVALGLEDDAGVDQGPGGAGQVGGLGASPGQVAVADDAARAAGWLVGTVPRLDLPSQLHRAVVRAALGQPDLRDIAQQCCEQQTGSAGAAVRAICLEALGRDEDAAREFLVAASHARQQEEGATGTAAAARWFEEVARLRPETLDVEQNIFLATSMAWQGRSQDALVLLERALNEKGPAARDRSFRLKLVERKAWLLTRQGDMTAARRLLEVEIADLATGSPPGNDDTHDGNRAAADDDLTDALWLARARLARVLVSMGCFAEALDAVAKARPESAGAALATESALLAHAYGGNLPAARRLHQARATKSLPPARVAYLGALLDQLGGDLRSALDGYRLALPAAESTGDIHTVAAIALNLGALAAEAGRYDEALAMQDRAIRELGRLGAWAELGLALFNAGMLLLELGDLAGARGILSRLRGESSETRVGGPGPPAVIGPVAMYLDAELALRDDDGTKALMLFTRAGEAAGLDAAVGRAARLARAELLGRGPHPGEAHALLDQLEQASGADPRIAADVRRARAKVLLAGATLNVEAAVRLGTQLQSDGEQAAYEGRRPHAWRAALAAGRLFHRGGQPDRAAVAVTVAIKLFQEIRMSTPPDHQAGIEQDSDARFLADLARLTAAGGTSGSDTRVTRASRSEDRLRRLLRINKRLNSELRLPRLLELIMDTVIELTEAERGFILLDDDKGQLTVKVARNIDQQTLETDAFNISRSIARQAAAGGTPIITIDAAGDPRFREALSVSDLHLRSVLAVPLQVKGRAVGTLYVDNRLRQGAFGDDDVQLVLDFAEQAGIAIENARLLAELRRRERQIEVLNRRLQGELAVRKEEMVGMRQELRENREALAIRYDYRNIIGRTPRMLDLFRLLDRLTDTALPVVIQGESGTGKELVARALHFNGPRRERSFVSENCAAIPETLLESTLFGSVRGAYTGADHDSRGLFEVADGGTLFLDEVGEMSPGMQGKLLRILQTGELRRVGSERARKVDVRVVAATNRDLGRMVEEGRFRQDLFFRLSVAPITLPPLRDRRDDIPAIVEHILKNLVQPTKDPSGPRRVAAAALSRLCAYRWPGNVRELENELMRAAALSDGQIEVGDLSPRVAGDAETALTTLENPDDLSLRPRVERLERALLREALSRSGGNQTRAAVALGLSRFGLQKKLHRYQMGST